MSVIKLTLPLGEVPVNGKQVTFVAPCDCTVTEALEINGEQYTVVDSLCKCVTGSGGRWAAGATVCVALDVDNKRAFLQNATGGAMIATGSYVGTGESGEDNPNTLTFDFVPKVLWVGQGAVPSFYTNEFGGVYLSGQMFITNLQSASSASLHCGSWIGDNHISVDGRTVSWYSEGQATVVDGEYAYVGGVYLQLNVLGETYNYFAIG